MMTPEEFANRMRQILETEDIEGGHKKMDDLMCALLVSLGYIEGIDIYNTTHKWYA